MSKFIISKKAANRLRAILGSAKEHQEEIRKECYIDISKLTRDSEIKETIHRLEDKNNSSGQT